MGARTIWIDMRDEYAVVKVVAIINSNIVITFFFIINIEDDSIIKSFE